MLRLSVLAAAFVVAHASTGAAQMEPRVSDEELKAFHDKHYPFVEQGAEPPGRSVPDPRNPRLSTWSGAMHWCTRHGPTIVWMGLGRPFRVDSARYPDGTRGVAQHMLDYGWRRRAADGRRWIHGHIEITSDDVIFTDGAQPLYTPPAPSEVPNLEADLARDPDFLAEVQDDRFAHGVYAVLRNRTFYKGQDERDWLCGDRQVAGVMRDLRGLGESYQDWFPHGGLRGVYPDDRAEREAMLRKQIAESSQPFSFDRHLSAIPAARRAEILKELEARRAEYEKHLPAMEEQRLKSLELAQSALAKLDDNADVFTAIHQHFTRLGWRTETTEDRARTNQRKLNDALAALAELKELARRPEGMPGEWAERLRPLPPQAGLGVEDMAQRTRELASKQQFASPIYSPGYQVILEQSPGAHTRHLGWPQWSDEERELRSGGLRRRLGELALTGRVSKEEYDVLAQRLIKTGFW
jgi:hypothetical protein